MITYRKLGKLGRLGNQLFEVAGTTLYAQHFGFRAAFPHWIGCDVFKNMRAYTAWERLVSRILPTRQLVDMKSHPWWKPTRLWTLQELYDRGEDNINFYGYLQDPLSFELLQKFKSDILKLFSFTDEIETAYKNAVRQYEPYIALHLRRGDFVRLGYALPSEFYHNILQKICNGRKIYVSSDDPNIQNELSNLKLETFKLDNPLPHVPGFMFDFWVIKNAQTVVGCGSTFSWWAAYLGNKNDYWSPPLTHLWPATSRRSHRWPKHEKNPSISKINL